MNGIITEFLSGMKIAVIGGDARTTALCDALGEAGGEIALYGLDYTYNRFGYGEVSPNITRCASLESAIGGASAVILPLPYSIDGVRVNCPLGGYDIRLEKLFSLLESGISVIGGRLDGNISALAERAGVKLTDYYARDDLAVLNAVPTAEGAVAVAMSELPVTIAGSDMLVYGYGRVGRTLAGLLKAMGANVTAAARKASDLAWIKAASMTPFFIYDKPQRSYTAVFNTVPAPVLTRDILECFDVDTLIIELASKPGGIDMAAAGELGLRVIWALSLPGKVAPVTSGRAIAECIIDIMRKERI